MYRPLLLVMRLLLSRPIDGALRSSSFMLMEFLVLLLVLYTSMMLLPKDAAVGVATAVVTAVARGV